MYTLNVWKKFFSPAPAEADGWRSARQAIRINKPRRGF